LIFIKSAPAMSIPSYSRRLAPLVLALALAACGAQSGSELRTQAQQLRMKGDYAATLIALKNAAQVDPGNAENRYLLALSYLDTGDALAAEKEARLALKGGYAHEQALAALGRALVMRGEFRKALDEIDGKQDAAARALLPVRADARLALGEREPARALFAQALQAAPGSAAALVGLGRVAYLDGDAAAAHGYADRVLKAEPGNLEGLMFEADLLRAEGKHEQAFDVYDQVLKLAPQHRSAHVEKAYLAIGLGRYDMAQAELDTAFKIAPGSLLAVYTQALLDYTRGRYPAARDSLHKLLKAAPEHMPSVLLAGAVSLKLGSNYLAEHHFRHYLESHPDNVQARKMLASALLGTGHGQEALGVLEPALKADGADVQLLAIAGDSNMQTRRFGSAADLFAQASALDPDSAELRTSLGLSRLNKGDTAQAVRELEAATALGPGSVQAAEALVRTQLQLGRVDAAQAAAAALQRARPNSPVAFELLGQIAAVRKDGKAARAAFERALELDPAHYPAAAALAQLALDAKNPQGARQALEAFLERNKRSVAAMSALAALAADEGKQADTTRWLEAAAAVDPAAIGPAVNLIAHYLRTDAPARALNLARKLQVANPENADLLDLLAKSQLANGMMKEALATYQNLAVALPRSAQVLMQVAALHLLLNNTVQAEDDLKGVLAMQPDFPSAQVELAELYVRKGSPDLALIIAGRMQRLHPEGSAGWQLEGDVLMAKRQPAAALAAYERAFKLRPANELLIKADSALRLAGRKPEAAQRLDSWLAAHPADARTLAYRAQTWLAEGQFRQAAGQLEAVQKLAPKNPVVLNNLALAYQALDDARALPTAEAALQRAGEVPDVMDTLAWILVSRGDTARAVPMLQKAHALAPKARDIRYHLAAALYKAGERAAAKKELEALAAGDMRFAQAEEARRLLEQLRAEG
jgi:putative PEP-CTERM system TPR-repeat lipoprotein